MAGMTRLSPVIPLSYGARRPRNKNYEEKMDKDVKELIKDSADTMLNIAQMGQYRMRYLQNRDAKDKEKMIKYTVLSIAGIACLFMIGISGLVESRR